MTTATGGEIGGTGGMTLPDNFLALMGATVDEVGPDRVVMSIDVHPGLMQPWGILHGGVHCSMVESAASIAGDAWLGDAGTVVGVNNSTNFLRPVRDGRLTYTATPIQRGRTQQLWVVEGRSSDGKLVAQGQVRLANLRDD